MITQDTANPSDNDLNIKFEEGSPPPLIFPYHMGPAIAEFTSPLLYTGNITASTPAWLSEDVLNAFLTVGNRAAETKHSLERFLAFTYQNFEIAQVDCLETMDWLSPLKNRVTRTVTIYPATQEHFTF